jgi:hypothetical protein
VNYPKDQGQKRRTSKPKGTRANKNVRLHQINLLPDLNAQLISKVESQSHQFFLPQRGKAIECSSLIWQELCPMMFFGGSFLASSTSISVKKLISPLFISSLNSCPKVLSRITVVWQWERSVHRLSSQVQGKKRARRSSSPDQNMQMESAAGGVGQPFQAYGRRVRLSKTRN